MKARTFTSFVALIGALVTASLLLYASRNAPSDSKLSMLAFSAWALLPYLALYLSVRFGPLSGHWPVIVAIVGALITITALYAYIAGIFINPDPQSGLMFVALPAYQLVIAVVLLVVSLVLKRRT